MGFEAPLWRAVAVFRVAAAAYAIVAHTVGFHDYARPALRWPVLGVIVAWTALITWGYADPDRRRWPLLTADLGVAVACLSATWPVVGAEQVRQGAATLTMIWVAAPVIAWAIWGGRRRGAGAALAVGAVDLAVRGEINPSTLNATVLLLLAGVITGHLTRLARHAEQEVQRAAQREAAIAARERLARGIHDSVLQVLALVQRRGAELGGEAAQLGRLAGEQETTLRALVAEAEPEAADGPAGTVDLGTLLRRHAAPHVTIAAPAEPVRLPAVEAAELAAAVAAALDNVRVHCGPEAPAWVLVEAEPQQVTVTVRDDGPGIAPGRLAQAAVEGRLGVAQSIQGRLRELGGEAAVSSSPGQGTEVELTLPRSPVGVR